MFISFLWGVFVRGVFGKGVLSKGFLSGGLCPGGFVWGVFVLIPENAPNTQYEMREIKSGLMAMAIIRNY